MSREDREEKIEKIREEVEMGVDGWERDAYPSKNFIPSEKTDSTFSMRPSLFVLLFTAEPTAARRARVIFWLSSTSSSCLFGWVGG